VGATGVSPQNLLAPQAPKGIPTQKQSNKVKAIKTKEDFDEISKLMLAIKETANRFNLENDDLYGSFSMIAVSDSLIISVPYTDDTACFKFIEFVRYIQYTLLVTSFRTILSRIGVKSTFDR